MLIYNHCRRNAVEPVVREERKYDGRSTKYGNLSQKNRCDNQICFDQMTKLSIINDQLLILKKYAKL